MSVRPFSPSESFSFPKPPERQSMAPSTIHSPATIRADVNPFADPERAPTPSSYGSGSFIAGTRETVSRPFTPTMPDELLVIPGEEVVIIQAFDDGWAQVQNGRKEIGLIPFDCFRPRGEELPSFLASKRVSSYLGGSISA
ncbi:hypothetical protein OF83DRAFT_1049392 [Amylostereum chailletii]|nr:hypothetical protein OF83DRAFT_1049392 [Amylostereum chailletii]